MEEKYKKNSKKNLHLQKTARYAAGALRNIAVEESGRHQVVGAQGALARLQQLTSSQVWVHYHYHYHYYY